MTNLNTKQRRTLIAGMIVFVLMILFPPFVFDLEPPLDKLRLRIPEEASRLFYGFFTKRTEGLYVYGSKPDIPIKVDTTRITFQLLALLVVVGGLTLVLGDRKKETASQKNGRRLNIIN